MNQCCFYGKIVNKIKNGESDVENLKVNLMVEKYRKNKIGVTKIDRSFLVFEAWDSAAITIDKNASLGDYLLISNSNARNSGSSVCFRINEFKIVKKNKESIENECWTNGGR